jgi:hypothetical protein
VQPGYRGSFGIHERAGAPCQAGMRGRLQATPQNFALHRFWEPRRRTSVRVGVSLIDFRYSRCILEAEGFSLPHWLLTCPAHRTAVMLSTTKERASKILSFLVECTFSKTEVSETGRGISFEYSAVAPGCSDVCIGPSIAECSYEYSTDKSR